LGGEWGGVGGPDRRGGVGGGALGLGLRRGGFCGGAGGGGRGGGAGGDVGRGGEWGGGGVVPRRWSGVGLGWWAITPLFVSPYWGVGGGTLGEGVGLGFPEHHYFPKGNSADCPHFSWGGWTTWGGWG